MPISRPREPVGSREILHSALAKRLHGSRQLRCLRGAPKTGAPLPIYRIGRTATLRPNPLAIAKKIGWGFPIVGGEVPGVGYLTVKGAALRYAGVVEGQAAKRLWNAAALADRHMRSRKGSFEARILQIPTLRIRALWLHSRKQKSVFVVLRSARARLQLVTDIQPLVAAATHELLLRKKEALPGPNKTNAKSS
jgi:hypothetical protein